MPASKERIDYINEYKRKNYKRIALEVSKEKYDQIKAAADAQNLSVNGYIKIAIDEKIKNDN